MKEQTISWKNDVVKAENVIAAVASIIVPGLGQIYKGHVEAGVVWLCFGMPVVTFMGVVLGLATAGVGLLLPLACWAALAVDAYYEPNRRSHHWLPPVDA